MIGEQAMRAIRAMISPPKPAKIGNRRNYRTLGNKNPDHLQKWSGFFMLAGYCISGNALFNTHALEFGIEIDGASERNGLFARRGDAKVAFARGIYVEIEHIVVLGGSRGE